MPVPWQAFAKAPPAQKSSIMLAKPVLALFLAPLLAVALATAPAQAQFAAPEGTSGLQAKPLVTARKQMVVAAHPLAAEAGLEILNAGGSAVDAMIATQLVLNLVEPQSSGLGGGAFLLTWNSLRSELKGYDGRETAPAAATPANFLKADGTPLPFPEASVSGKSIGVPGVMHMLESAYKAHGRLPWARLFEPAIKLAETGFPLSARLNTLLASPELGGAASFDPAARAYFFDDTGKRHAAGHILRNPEFAVTLRILAEQGAGGFYSGSIAEAVVKSATQAPTHPSGMTLADLSTYQSIPRAPLCFSYRRHRICSMGPPSSGALTVGATLRLVEAYDLGKTPMAPSALHLIAEAEKLAFADRDQYIADPAFTTQSPGMLDAFYQGRRRVLIKRDTAMGKALPGEPPGYFPKRAGLDATIEAAGTSHLSIVDAQGNAVALTTTIENGFGSHRWAAGFLLNNQLTDFSFLPTDASGRAIANAVGPGKRPRSSMSPTFVFGPNGKLKAVLGSAGGSRIILHAVKTIVGIVDWGLDAQSAVDLPNFGSRNAGPFELETKVAGELLGAKLALFGHQVVNVDATSGLHVIIRRPDGLLEGGADARREGVARGD
jgi:gamma-glutamyltranspeptidase / glutathione hydrolase